MKRGHHEVAACEKYSSSSAVLPKRLAAPGGDLRFTYHLTKEESLDVASQRLGDAREAIASQEDTVAQSFLRYRKAEAISKRSAAVLTEWQFHCLELDMFLHKPNATNGRCDGARSGLPGQPRTATTDTRRTLEASRRLDHARDNIARLDNEVSRDYHAYREAETAWKRSVATLNEWQHHRLELELFLRDAFITQSQADLEVPSPSSPEVVWLERR